MINTNTLLVFDFETGSTDVNTTDVLEIAALCINPKTLNIIPNSEFQCLVKPKDWKNVQDEALKVNNLTKEKVEKEGLELKVAWQSFTDYIQNWNYKKNKWSAPIACGMNIKGFDIPIFNRVCSELGSPKDLFFGRNSIDVLDLCFYWFNNLSEPAKYNMDALRDFFGISKDGAHRALKDVEDTAAIIIRFLQYHRKHSTIEKFKGAFSK